MKKKASRQIKPGSTAFRTFELTREDINQDKRTVDLAFSSEDPYDRGYMIEILDHSPGAVNLDRLKSGGPLLLNHERDDQIGVIDSVRIGSDRVGRSVVRFGKSALADEIFTDVQDGIRRNVSVGYMIDKAVLQETGGDSADTYLVTRWTPFEVSIVPVPADITVGVGRAAEDGSGIEFIEEKLETETKGEKIMEPDKTNQKGTPDLTIDTGPEREAAERKRAADILAMGKQYARYEGVEMAASYVTSGKSVDEFRAALLEKAGAEPAETADLGLNEKEVKRFSFMKAVRALATPHDRKLVEDAAFEFECSRGVGDVMHREAQGLFVPQEVLQREFTVGAATGDKLVQTDLMSGDFISLLRNAMVLSQLGIRTLTGLVGDLAIPRQTGGATTYWLAESGAPTESDQAIDQVSLTPKTIAAYTDISRKLLKQSSIDVETFVQSDLAIALGLAIELAAINGSGAANQPTGILNTTGIGDVASTGANGDAPVWDDLVDLESDVAVANAAVGNLSYLVNAKTRGKLKKTFVDSGSNAERVWDVRSPGSPLNGYDAPMTNAVPSNLVKGASGATLSAMIFGNFADIIIGMWGALDLTVDRTALATSGGVRIIALQDVDVAIRHAESFSAMKSAVTV